MTSLPDLDRSLSARCSIASRDPMPRWAAWLRRVSQSGSYGAGWIAAFAFVAALIDTWERALVGAGCVLGTLLLNTCIKLVVRRPRPAVAVGHAPTSTSMPSAHSAMAVVGAACMTVIVPALAPLWWAWALVLAASRAVLGMHYVGDVLAGVALGAVAAMLVAVPLLQRLG